MYAQTSGGPDAYGYSWKNSNDATGPTYSWIQPDTVNATLIGGQVDDNIVGPYPIGFNFNFYGQTKTDFYISSNGFLSFSGDTSNLTNVAIPDVNQPNDMIAWYWRDMDPVSTQTPANNAIVYYENITYDGANALLVTFLNYHEYPGEDPGYLDAQIILKANGDIVIQYETVDPSLETNDGTIGIENSDGSIGLQYCFDDLTNLSQQMAISFYTVEAGYPEFAQNPVPVNGAVNVPVNGTLTWEFGADTETYDLWFGPAGNMTEVVTGAAAGATGTTGSYTYSGLNLSTNYEWKLVLHNSTTRLTTDGGTWSFRTSVGAVTTFPWTENFDVWPPVDWIHAGTQNWAQHTETSSAFCNFWGWPVPNYAEMTTPPLAIPAGSDYSLGFMWSHLYNSAYPEDSLVIEVSADNGPWQSIWAEGGDQLDSQDGAQSMAPGSFVTETVSLQSYAGQNIVIRFRGNSGYGPNLYVDAVTVFDGQNPPGCTTYLNPADMSIDQWDTGMLVFNQVLGADSYNIYMGTADGTWDVFDGVNTTESRFEYYGLQYSTTYYWKVVPVNQYGSASNCPVYSFTTIIDPSQPLDYTQDWETAMIPAHWQISTTDLSTVDVSMDNFHGGSYALHSTGMNWQNVTVDQATLSLAPYTGTTDVVLDFWYAFTGGNVQNTAYPMEMSVDIYAGGQWNYDVWNDQSSDEMWYLCSINLSSYDLTNGYKVRLNMTNTGSTWDSNVWIDDLTVYESSAAPACAALVQPLDMSTTEWDYGTLEWTLTQAASSYLLYLGTAQDTYDVINGMVLTDTHYDYSGLQYSTSYYWKIVPQNNNGQATLCAEWTFTTVADPAQTISFNEDWESGAIQSFWRTTSDPQSVIEASMENFHGGSYSLHTTGVNWGIPVENSAILTIAPYTGTSEVLLDFWYAFSGGNVNDNAMRMTIAVDIFADGAWNNDVWTIQSQNENWYNQSISLNPYNTSNLTKIRFRTINTADSWSSNVWIDDINVYENSAIPPCTTPVEPLDTAQAVYDYGVLEWMPALGAEYYNLYLGTATGNYNIINGMQLTETSYEYTGLSFDQQYFWKVVPENVNGQATTCPEWTFDTAIDPTQNLNFFEGWESVMIGDAWYPELSETGICEVTSEQFHGGMYSARLGHNTWGSTSENSAVVTMAPYSAGNQVYFDGWFGFFGWSVTDQTIAKEIHIDIMENNVWNNDIFVDSTDTEGWFNVNIDLSGYNIASAYKLRIRSRIGTSWANAALYMDDLNVFEAGVAPSCTTVLSPTFMQTNVLESGQLTWNPAMGADDYLLYFGTATGNYDIEDGLVVTTESYQFSALTYNATYYWKVVPRNAMGSTTGCPEWSFTVRSDPTVTMFPYTENFDIWPPQNWILTGGTQSWAQDTGSSSAFCNYWGWQEPNDAVMMSPPIALTGDADLVFKWSHLYNATYPNDALTVFVSTDANNWTNVWTRAGDQFDSQDGAQSTAPGTFIQETVNINAFSGQTIYLKFHGVSGYGPNCYVDDVGINITTPPNDDLMAISVIGSTTPMVGSPSDYTISVRNNGLNTQNTFDVKLMLAPDTELGTVAGTTIANDQINDYVITWIPQDGMEGNQNIFGKVVMAGDESAGNDNSAPLPVDVQPSQTGIQGYVRDINGNPLFNAQVLIEELQTVQYTGNNGFYQFLNVPADTYTVTATLTNYDNNTQTNVVVTQDNLTNVDFTMTQGAILMGTVYDHANVEVAGALVEIEQLAITTTTDAQGNYTFVQVTPGTYTVNATKDGYIDQTESNVVIAADATVDLDIILIEYGHFTVNITTNLNSPTGAVVELTDGTNTYTETSDDTGVVLLNEVLPGTYNLTASLPDCNIHEQQNIVIVNGDNTPVDVTLDEILIAPTNIQWLNNDRILVWQHGDRLYGTRTDGESALAEGVSYVEREAENEEDERQFMYFRVEIDIINQTTSDTFFTVNGFAIGEQLTARVTAIYETGTAAAPDYDFTFEEVANDPDDVNLVTELKGNYPNPFNPTTHIEFSLKKAGNVELAIYNINGQKVRTLVSEEMEADNHKVTWNGKDDRGNSVSSGVYFYRLQTSEVSQTKKMLMLK